MQSQSTKSHVIKQSRWCSSRVECGPWTTKYKVAASLGSAANARRTVMGPLSIWPGPVLLFARWSVVGNWVEARASWPRTAIESKQANTTTTSSPCSCGHDTIKLQSQEGNKLIYANNLCVHANGCGQGCKCQLASNKHTLAPMALGHVNLPCS